MYTVAHISVPARSLLSPDRINRMGALPRHLLGNSFQPTLTATLLSGSHINNESERLFVTFFYLSFCLFTTPKTQIVLQSSAIRCAQSRVFWWARSSSVPCCQRHCLVLKGFRVRISMGALGFWTTFVLYASHQPPQIKTIRFKNFTGEDLMGKRTRFEQF